MIYTHDNMNHLFNVLEATKGIAQFKEHHPEGDVFTHSLQVLYFAMRETDDTDLILASMMHDVGKAVDSHRHESMAIKLLDGYLSTKSLFLIEHHMRFWTWIKGQMHKLGKVTWLAQHPWLPELAQLARWDKQGRRPGWIPKYDRQVIIDRLNEKVINKYPEEVIK